MEPKLIEEIRKQTGLDINKFAEKLTITPEQYLEYQNVAAIDDDTVQAKVVEIALDMERQNLLHYRRNLERQPMGPFDSGKILDHLETIVGLRDTPAQVVPITVELHLSNRCNHDCPYCTFKDTVRESELREQMFPDELLDPLIADLQALGVKAVVYSGGGEPLLHPAVTRVLAAVDAAGIRQGMITNGIMLERAEIRDAVLKYCDWVRISVDAGSQEVYRAIHGPAADFARLRASVEQTVAAKKNIPNAARLGVSFLLMGNNYHDLVPSACLFKKLGVDYFQVKPVVVPPADRMRLNHIFWRKEVFEHLVALPELAVTGKYDVYTLGFKFVDMILNPEEKLFKRCYGHPLYPTITATGKVYICCLMLGQDDYCYGQLTADRGFRELWGEQQRFAVGGSVKVSTCPVNCKLSETNKVLEHILGTDYTDAYFLS